MLSAMSGNVSFISRRPKDGFTMVELAIVAVIFVLVIIALTPFIHLAKDWANTVDCAHNLRKISLGLHAYAADHNGMFPSGLKELYPAYVENEKFFYCPAAKHDNKAGENGYDYMPGLTESSAPGVIIARDKEGNHAKLGMNVLKVNGSLEWIRYKKEISRVAAR